MIPCLQEGANVTHIVGKLDGVLNRIATEKENEEIDGDIPKEKSYLRQKILDIRKSLEDQGQQQRELAASSDLSL